MSKIQKFIKKLIFIIYLSSFFSFADTDIFTVIDNSSRENCSFKGDIFTEYIAMNGNTRKFNFSNRTMLTWFQKINAYSLLVGASNNSTDGHRNLEKYQAGIRAKHNLNYDNYLFTQSYWLSDRYNGYHSLNTFTGGYGSLVLKGPIHNLLFEIGPGVRHEEYFRGGRSTKTLISFTALYAYQLTNNTKFDQKTSILAYSDITINSQTGLNVNINDYLTLKIAYNITWNNYIPKNLKKNIDTKTSLFLVYHI
ncbi:MAG: YdiY family protein [Sodalis sp. (in: enterobacteria)]